MKCWQFEAVLAEKGWLEPGFVMVDDQGVIESVETRAPGRDVQLEKVSGWAIPAFQNAHSHSFHYAMAGMAECLPKGAEKDDFWTWREVMYSLALRISPEEIQANAAFLFAEMLRFGITAVGEFLYLHHDRSGQPYSNLAEISERLFAAANEAGIRITVIPVYYHTGDFGKPASERQRRFLFRDTDQYFQLVAAAGKAAKQYARANVAIGVHSLRASGSEDFKAVLETAEQDTPVHFHISEQQKEIDRCVEHLKKRPVEWLLENVSLDQRHNLVHATHLTHEETQGLARSGATVVLCPTTEGNVGDGFFPFKTYWEAGGHWTIGTDTHISLSPLEDLRFLDYGQRLVEEKRNVFCLRGGEESGTVAFCEAWRRGRLALGDESTKYFESGTFLDAVVLDPNHPMLFDVEPAKRLSALIYAADPICFLGTICSGEWVVHEQRHIHRETLLQNFKKHVGRLRHN